MIWTFTGALCERCREPLESDECGERGCDCHKNPVYRHSNGEIDCSDQVAGGEASEPTRSSR